MKLLKDLSFRAMQFQRNVILCPNIRTVYKNKYIEVHRTIILPFLLYGCETWSLTLADKRRLRFLRIEC